MKLLYPLLLSTILLTACREDTRHYKNYVEEYDNKNNLQNTQVVIQESTVTGNDSTAINIMASQVEDKNKHKVGSSNLVTQQSHASGKNSTAINSTGDVNLSSK